MPINSESVRRLDTKQSRKLTGIFRTEPRSKALFYYSAIAYSVQPKPE